jgi:magnesium transporter
MPLSADNQRSATPQEQLDAVSKLLAKQRLVEELVHRQGERNARKPALVESLVHKQNLAELQRRLDGLHPADVAFILEGLPLEERLLVWGLVRSDRDGDILLEVSDAVRDTLLADMDSAEIVAAARNLDADEIADLAPDLPHEVVQDIIEAQDVHERAQLQSALSYPEGSVGALMDFEMVTIREDVCACTTSFPGTPMRSSWSTATTTCAGSCPSIACWSATRTPRSPRSTTATWCRFPRTAMPTRRRRPSSATTW